jgi:hypothetical protein
MVAKPIASLPRVERTLLSDLGTMCRDEPRIGARRADLFRGRQVWRQA